MIDILADDPRGRLAVIELKADEDIHLPLQGVDYWSRVAWHQSRKSSLNSAISPDANLAPKASAHAGRARAARASDHRHDPALPVAGNRLGSVLESTSTGGKNSK
jgi:hypothetical protein